MSFCIVSIFLLRECKTGNIIGTLFDPFLRLFIAICSRSTFRFIARRIDLSLFLSVFERIVRSRQSNQKKKKKIVIISNYCEFLRCRGLCKVGCCTPRVQKETVFRNSVFDILDSLFHRWRRTFPADVQGHCFCRITRFLKVLSYVPRLFRIGYEAGINFAKS